MPRKRSIVVQILVISIIFLPWLVTGGTQASEPLEIRVLSYNIHHARGMDEKLDLPRIARVISSVKPDLVSLQEVDQNVTRSEKVDQPAELARLTNMEVVFGKNIDLQGGNYGNAVLSRFPIVRSENHHLPLLDEGEQRGALEVEVGLPERAETIVLIATHLDHRRDDRERLESASVLNQFRERLGRQPAILAGDLNAEMSSPVLQRLLPNWPSANEEVMPTIPVREPRRQIDFILMSPASRWEVVEVRVLDEQVASDHRPIFAVLRLVAESP